MSLMLRRCLSLNRHNFKETFDRLMLKYGLFNRRQKCHNSIKTSLYNLKRKQNVIGVHMWLKNCMTYFILICFFFLSTPSQILKEDVELVFPTEFLDPSG